MVDTYSELYKTGINYQNLDGYDYTFIVKRGSRKVKLVSIEYE